MYASLSEALDMCAAENIIINENMAESLTPVKNDADELNCVFSYLCSTTLRVKATYLCYTCMTCNTHTPGHPSTADHDV